MDHRSFPGEWGYGPNDLLLALHGKHRDASGRRCIQYIDGGALSTVLNGLSGSVQFRIWQHSNCTQQIARQSNNAE